MAARKKSASTDVSITLEDAKNIMALFDACVLADRHFHSCQGDLFRRHVCASYKAKNTNEAYLRLKEQIKPTT